MISIVRQTIDFYLKNKKTPTINDLKVDDSSLLAGTGKVFVTIYKNGEIAGSAGNMQEIEPTILEELVGATIAALEDKRFENLTLGQTTNIKIRVDKITNRNTIEAGAMDSLDPMKNGIIAIDRHYNKLAVILPNISPSLMSGTDFRKALAQKLEVKEFIEKDYIIYQIETESVDDI